MKIFVALLLLLSKAQASSDQCISQRLGDDTWNIKFFNASVASFGGTLKKKGHKTINVRCVGTTYNTTDDSISYDCYRFVVQGQLGRWQLVNALNLPAECSPTMALTTRSDFTNSLYLNGEKWSMTRDKSTGDLVGISSGRTLKCVYQTTAMYGGTNTFNCYFPPAKEGERPTFLGGLELPATFAHQTQNSGQMRQAQAPAQPQ